MDHGFKWKKSYEPTRFFFPYHLRILIITHGDDKHYRADATYKSTVYVSKSRP